MSSWQVSWTMVYDKLNSCPEYGGTQGGSFERSPIICTCSLVPRSYHGSSKMHWMTHWVNCGGASCGCKRTIINAMKIVKMLQCGVTHPLGPQVHTRLSRAHPYGHNAHEFHFNGQPRAGNFTSPCPRRSTCRRGHTSAGSVGMAGNE